MDEAEDRLFELVLGKIDELHTDVKAYHVELQTHIKEDQELARDVYFVKRAFQFTWAGLAMILAWLGVRNGG